MASRGLGTIPTRYPNTYLTFLQHFSSLNFDQKPQNRVKTSIYLVICEIKLWGNGIWPPKNYQRTPQRLRMLLGDPGVSFEHFHNFLTAVIQGGQPKCSQVKSPTINLTILNQFYGYWEGLCKIFANFISGKALFFALKVWEFLRKCGKIWC